MVQVDGGNRLPTPLWLLHSAGSAKKRTFDIVPIPWAFLAFFLCQPISIPFLPSSSSPLKGVCEHVHQCVPVVDCFLHLVEGVAGTRHPVREHADVVVPTGVYLLL